MNGWLNKMKWKGNDKKLMYQSSSSSPGPSV